MPKQLSPKVTFYPDKSNKNKDGLSPIKANVTINYRNQTKIVDHVLPTDWNKKQQRVRPPRPGKSNNHELINQKLDKLQSEFDELTRRNELNNLVLTPDIVKRFLNGERHFTSKPFWQAYDEYLLMKNIEPKTRQNYKLYYTKLQEFEKYSNYYINYNTINTLFFERYKHYILTEKGLGWNTFATAIKKLKFFMNWSLDMKYHNEKEYKEFSATEKEPTIIFLNMDELSTLYHYEFNSDRLSQVRDKFCFGCFTGLAFSDLDSLTHDHINNGTLTKLRQKSKIALNIELPKQAVKIIKRYKGKYKVLPKISNQKLNEYIKECCAKAGINTPTVYKDFSKGVTTEKISPKHELIGVHTARKTFISIFYHNTKDINLTKKNAGITQDKTLRRYMGTDKEMEKEAMKKAFGNLK